MSISKTENGTEVLHSSPKFSSPEVPSNHSSIEVSSEIFVDVSCSLLESCPESKTLVSKESPDSVVPLKTQTMTPSVSKHVTTDLNNHQKLDKQLSVDIEDDCASSSDNDDVSFSVIGQPLAMSSPSSCAVAPSLLNPKDVSASQLAADSVNTGVVAHTLKNGAIGSAMGLSVPPSCKRRSPDQLVAPTEDEVHDSNASISNWSMTSLEAIESCFQQKISRVSSPSSSLEPLLLPTTTPISTASDLTSSTSDVTEHPNHAATKFSRISNLPLQQQDEPKGERNENEGGSTGSDPSSGVVVTPNSLQSASSCSPTTTSSTSEDTDSGVGCSNDEMMGDPTEDSPTDEKDPPQLCGNEDSVLAGLSATSSMSECTFGPISELGVSKATTFSGSTNGGTSSSGSNGRRRCIKFGNVTVYYFSRAQGFTCVPAQGGSTLGMSPQHVSREQYSFSDYRKMRHSKKRQLLKSRRAKHFKRQLTFAPPSPSPSPTPRPTTPDSSSNDADCSSTSCTTSPSACSPPTSCDQEAVQSNCGNNFTEDGLSATTTTDAFPPDFALNSAESVEEVNFDNAAVEELDDSFSLEVVPLKKRRKILKECGVDQIDLTEHKECEWIRASREDCGCNCRVVCDPRTCLCSLNGIKCQVDRQSYPCGCTKQGCGNQSGRIEFNLYRVRTHFFYTLLRLQQHRQKMNSGLGQGGSLFGMVSSDSSATGCSNTSGSDTEDAADDYSLKAIDDADSYADCQNGLTNITGEKGECANYCCLGVASRTTTYPDESHSKMMQQYYCSGNMMTGAGIHGLTTASNTASSLTGPSYVSNVGCNSFDHSAAFQNEIAFVTSDNSGSIASLTCSSTMDSNEHSNLFSSQPHGCTYSEEDLIENDEDEESDEASNACEEECQKNTANFESSERIAESDDELATEDSDYFVETEEEVNIVDSPDESLVSQCKLGTNVTNEYSAQSSYDNQGDFRNLNFGSSTSCGMYQMGQGFANVSSNSHLHQSHHTTSPDLASFCFESTTSGPQNSFQSAGAASALNNQISGTASTAAFDVYAPSQSSNNCSSSLVSHASSSDVSFCSSNEQSNNVYVQSPNHSVVNHASIYGHHLSHHLTSSSSGNQTHPNVVSNNELTSNPVVNFTTEMSPYYHHLPLNGSTTSQQHHGHAATDPSASDGGHWHHDAYTTQGDTSSSFPFWSTDERLQPGLSSSTTSDLCEPKPPPTIPTASEHVTFPNCATNNISSSSNEPGVSLTKAVDTATNENPSDETSIHCERNPEELSS